MSNDPVVLALQAAIARGDSPALRNALGKHHLAHGAAAEALASFEAALALDPSDAQRPNLR